MPAPNYRFEKRQRELARQKKKEEKRLKKLAARKPGEPETAPDADAGTAPAPDTQAS